LEGVESGLLGPKLPRSLLPLQPGKREPERGTVRTTATAPWGQTQRNILVHASPFVLVTRVARAGQSPSTRTCPARPGSAQSDAWQGPASPPCSPLHRCGPLGGRDLHSCPPSSPLPSQGLPCGGRSHPSHGPAVSGTPEQSGSPGQPSTASVRSHCTVGLLPILGGVGLNRSVPQGGREGGREGEAARWLHGSRGEGVRGWFRSSGPPSILLPHAPPWKELHIKKRE